MESQKCTPKTERESERTVCGLLCKPIEHNTHLFAQPLTINKTVSF